ncbi:ABC transporter permease [Bythopirellula goksoeyrii]|uniref:ABC transporter permease n=1 Tax=Bythopirellula goksoeyrii TaxID=1400387 RepID=A0A5B9Q1W0_9BACT|nr:ABC transporter permease [Bythopirellula goksoeyrii]QEG32968.1 hypothetical protein Pr1d_02290 [Bythopirellula goksoeyrii]
MQTITYGRLALSFLPVLVVFAVMARWSIPTGRTVTAVMRMLVQLLAVGYVLTFIFETDHAAIVMATLALMITAASWISLGPVQEVRGRLFLKAFVAICLGSVATLALITQGVLDSDPWFEPRQLIPLGGMIFANSMNTVSIAAERFLSECALEIDYEQARHRAMRAALIPLTNSLLAVGIVSFPGMMTGQILAGESPVIAARYQIMVMCMVFGAGGISAASFLAMLRGKAEINHK